jgi:hypothetical protein
MYQLNNMKNLLKEGFREMQRQPRIREPRFQWKGTKEWRLTLCKPLFL